MVTTRILYDLVGRDNASRAFDSAGRSASGLERGIARVGKAVALAGTAMAAGAVAIGVESVKAAASFQSSMEKIHTQAGASQKSVRLLSDEVLRLGSHTQQGPQQLADSLFHLKSVGLDNVKAMRALRTASDLAAVGGANLEETTNALAGAWRSGIKGAQNFGAAAATLNAIVGAGNMRMEDLVAAMGTGFLPTARSFGVSLKSVGAALALMTDEGIPAEMAATRLRMSINLLGAPTATAAKQLATIGLSSSALANAMRGPGGIVAAVTLLKSHLDASGLSATQSAALLSRAFGGGRSSSAILTLVNNLEVLRRKQQQINDTTGRYAGAVAAQRRTAQAQFALLRSSLDVIAVRIGSVLLPFAVKLSRLVSTVLLPALGKVARAFMTIIPVAAIERDWHRLLQLFGLEKPKPVKLTTADLIHLTPGVLRVPSLRLPKPVKLTTADLIHPTPGPMGSQRMLDLIHPVAAAKAGANVLSGIDVGKIAGQFAGRLVSSLVATLGKIDWVNAGKAVGGHAIGFGLGFLSAIGADLFTAAFWKKHWLDAILGGLALIGLGRLGGILAKFLEHVPFLRILAPLFRGLEKISQPFWKAGGKLLRSLGAGILDGIRVVLPHSGEALAKWLELLPIRLGLLGLKFADLGVKLIRGLGMGLLSMARFTGKIIGIVIGWLLRPWIGIGRWLLRRGADLISGLLSGILSRFPAVARWLGGLARRVTAPLRGAARWLLGIGGNIISGLLGGIRAKMAGIGSWIMGNVVNPIIGAVKRFFGIKSPSTVMHGIGFQLITGLVRGIVSANPVSAVTRVFGSMPRALGAIVKKGLVSVASLPGRALRALGGLGGKILSLLGLGGGPSSSGALGGGAAANMALARRMMPAWASGAQWANWNYLNTRESGWNRFARNASSGAYGIPQALPESKLPFAGRAAGGSHAGPQIGWQIGYIRGRYRDPIGAAAHERRFGWYGRGGRFRAGQLIGVGDRGPELVSFSRPGRVYSPEASAAMMAPSGGEFTGNLYLDSGELLGIVRGQIREHDRGLKRRVTAGAGRVP